MATQSSTSNTSTSTFEPALPPPPGVTPHPDNPESLARVTSVTISVCISFVTVFFLLRCYVRLFIKKTWIFEDFLVTIGWAGAVSYCGITRAVMMHHGGQHGWDITKEQSHHAAYWFNIAAVYYGVMVAVAKIAVLWLYRRVFSPVRRGWFDVAIVTLIIVTVGFYGSTTFVKIFECSPRQKIWNREIPGKCIQMKWVLNMSGAFNMVSDYIIILLPVQAVWRLQMDRMRKMLVILAFTFGLCAPIFATIGFVVRLRNTKDRDTTWKQPEILLWGAAELSSSMLCVCFPELAILFRKLICYTGSTSRHRPTASRYASMSKGWRSKHGLPSRRHSYLPKTLPTNNFSVNGDVNYIELQDQASQGNNIHVTSEGRFAEDDPPRNGVVIKNEIRIERH